MIKYVSILDYGSGNLYSIKQALLDCGFIVKISSEKKELEKSDALILPGVGAFSDAIKELKNKNLIDFIKDYADSNKTLIGICLGMQLLMSESNEFGNHKGLNLISGKTSKFNYNDKNFLKVPQIGWNHISPYKNDSKLWK